MATAGIVVFDGRLSFPVIAKPVRAPAVAIRAPRPSPRPAAAIAFLCGIAAAQRWARGKVAAAVPRKADDG